MVFASIVSRGVILYDILPSLRILSGVALPSGLGHLGVDAGGIAG